MAKTKQVKGLSNREAYRRLKEQCAAMAATLERDGLIADDQHAAVKPGAPDNEDRGLWGWIRYSQHLLLLMNGAGGGARADAGDDVFAAGVDRRQLAVHADTPRTVPLAPAEDGTERHVQVHPKSLGALLDIHNRDVLIGWLWIRVGMLNEVDGTAEELQEFTRAMQEIEYQQSLILWALTSKGPRLPFDPDLLERPGIPPYVQALHPGEALKILAAHQYVNNAALRGLEAMFDIKEKRGHDRPFRYSVFVGTLADKLSRPAGELMWDWTYAALLSQAGIAASAHREAFEDAEAESKRRTRRRGDESEEFG